uniref:Basic proline-rich protein n=1 Tax=Parastrongyloides trichosuri TaxID=131310 RepID=A0A0N4ZVR3_PARTI
MAEGHGHHHARLRQGDDRRGLPPDDHVLPAGRPRRHADRADRDRKQGRAGSLHPRHAPAGRGRQGRRRGPLQGRTLPCPAAALTALDQGGRLLLPDCDARDPRPDSLPRRQPASLEARTAAPCEAAGHDGAGLPDHRRGHPDRPPARPRRRAGHRPGSGPVAAQLLVGQAAVHPRPARPAQVGLSLPSPDAEEPRDRARLLAAGPARREGGAASSPLALADPRPQTRPSLLPQTVPLKSLISAHTVT